MILIDTKGHMVSTESLDELHQFAKRIGLKRAWFQDKRIPHYDLTTKKKLNRALSCGAKIVTSRELAKNAIKQLPETCRVEIAV